MTGCVGDIPGFWRSAEEFGTPGLLAAHKPPSVAQSAVEVDVGLEGVGVFEYSPAVPADVTLFTCKENTTIMMRLMLIDQEKLRNTLVT